MRSTAILPEGTTSGSTGTGSRTTTERFGSCRPRSRITTASRYDRRGSRWGSTTEGSAVKNREGMTLIEVMIAIVITFIVFLGLSGSGIFVMNENIKNSLRDEAVSVAGME